VIFYKQTDEPTRDPDRVSTEIKNTRDARIQGGARGNYRDTWAFPARVREKSYDLMLLLILELCYPRNSSRSANLSNVSSVKMALLKISSQGAF
jgi:hypothetical protein